MINHLRRIAERGAGPRLGALKPLRAPWAFNVPAIGSQAIAKPPAGDQPALVDILRREGTGAATAALLDQRATIEPPRPRELTPPAAANRPRPAALESTRPVDSTPASALTDRLAAPPPLGPRVSPRVDAASLMATENSAPMTRPSPTLDSSADDDQSRGNVTSLQPVTMEWPVVHSTDERVAAETVTIEAPAPAPPKAVRLEPLRSVEFPPAQAPTPAAVAASAEAPIGPRTSPLLVHERMAASTPRGEVRVSIGHVDVRVESNTLPAPAVVQRIAPSDPFASLAMARRGWRSTL